ncbi:hypothetical protein [Sporomusa acidovorans]|uniref:Uncharacterized protein n=1 Tax=Sporomusa acidovorans (strain ATCC 49682 / DSM 3132 / Mol) TaxID=1123286 RepID=A0ABZ3IX65_SPOA4|nr:hypothetical protein [Sporomusa acidovorans]OZC23663.1 hypothetical protein SPACI_05650 [Sporomusa acidovorans DSM 3132]SDE24295.1 hypothetical protein SAMN04488499_101091 [Sporomusa acidovorans]
MKRIKKTMSIDYEGRTASFTFQCHMPHLTPREQARVVKKLLLVLVNKP